MRNTFRSRLAPLLLAAAAAVAWLAPLAAGAAPVAQPLTYEGYAFDTSARVADTELVLNGLGKRAALAIYKVYAAALYLPRKQAVAAAILADTGPRRLQLRMLMDGPSEEFVKAFDKGLAKRVPADQLATMQPRVAEFDTGLRAIGDLHKGDVVNLDYAPGHGTAIIFNGKPRGGVVAGADLYAAVLGIFIGDKPIDKGLKAGLLGGPPN